MKTQEQIEALLAALQEDQDRLGQELERLETQGIRWNLDKWRTRTDLYQANQSKIKTLYWILETP